MSQKERETVEKIRSRYTEIKRTKLDELKDIHKTVKRPADIFAYIFGSFGTLVLGGGMCLAMPEVVEGYMIPGIIIGVVGIVMVSVNYFIYKAVLNSRKKKYSNMIFELSNDILNEI